MKTYLVGGAVRDQLLSIAPKERDWLVVGGTAEQMDHLGFRPVGKDFPVFLHPTTQEEYALARTERKSGRGYKGFTFHTSPNITIEEDLLRRDLTINAIAQDPDTKQLIDPYGGQADINERILRHVSPSFAEDPLRVLRVARFAARFSHLGFNIHPDTLQLMRQLADSGELNTLATERIWQEMDKALRTNTPSLFFETLLQCSALARISPELAKLFSVNTTPSNSEAINQTHHNDSTAKRYAQLWHCASMVDLAEKALINRHNTSLTTPKYHDQLACAVALHSQIFDHAHLSSAETVLQLFNNLNTWRANTLTEDFLEVCAIRTKPDNAELLRNCYRSAIKVDVASLQAKGCKGQQLGEAIAAERLRKINTALKAAAPSN